MSMIQTPKPEDNTTNNNNVEAAAMSQQQQELQQQTTSCPRNSHTHHQVSNNINVYVQQKQQQPVKHHVHRHNVRSRYEFLETLGRGTYGKVKLARSKETNEHVAIKTIRKDKVDNQLDMTHIRREMEILSQISHPNIIKIYEVFENQEKIVIVMEYAAGGELYDYISRKRQLNEDETKALFRQVVSAVRYCHKQGIVHRDLKLENILLDRNNRIKIADFGLSNHFRADAKLHTFCGSPLYASPEIVNGTPYKGPEVDSWSLGVLLYALTYGSMPFDGSNYSRLSQNISDGKYVQPAVPSNAHDLIDWLLQVDPEKRATIDDVECHRWLDAGADHVGVVKETTTMMIETTPKPAAVTTTTASTTDPYIVTPKSILKHAAPSIELTSPQRHHHHQRRLETPSSEAELEGQLAMVCGLHARDSLKLKNRLHLHSGVQPNNNATTIAYKRRLLRAKRDRESGYYSSPERLLSSSSSSGGHQHQQQQAAPNSPSAPMAPGDLSQMMHELSVKLTSTPTQVTYERLAGGDDGSSRSTTPRPHSTYSDSSVLSSDSFNLCSFATTPTLESPLHQLQHNDQQRPLSMPIMPDQLPTPTPSELDQPPPGTLSPKSEQLLRGLERILMTSSSNRRTSSSSSGGYHHHHRTTDPYNHYAAPPPAYIPPFQQQQQQYPPSYNTYDASGVVTPITPPTPTTSYVQYNPPPYRHHHYTSLHNQPVYEQPPALLVQPTIIEESAVVVVPTAGDSAVVNGGNGIHADISAQV